LVSAFASTTGILAALVPLALPLVDSGDVAGWALISALAVCASIVDVSPFSTVGATLIASAVEEERPRMTSLLTRWGMSMVLIGPLVLVSILVLPSKGRPKVSHQPEHAKQVASNFINATHAPDYARR
jgi:hypothetical protein